MTPDYDKIKIEYVTTDITLKELSKKYGVSYQTLRIKSSKDKWTDAKTKHKQSIYKDIQETHKDRIVSSYADRVERFNELTNKLYGKIADSIECVDMNDRNGMKQLTSCIESLRGLWDIVPASTEDKTLTIRIENDGTDDSST